MAGTRKADQLIDVGAGRPAVTAAPAALPFLAALRPALPLLLLALAMLPLLWWSLTAAPALLVDVGQWGDHSYLSGINGIEQSSSEDYRWTTDHATLTLPNLSGDYQLLRMRAHGWRPEGAAAPQLRLNADGQAFGQFQTRPEMRIYQILLPRAAGLDRQVGFDVDGYHPPQEARILGIAIDWLHLGAVDRAVPGLAQFAGQALLLLLLALLITALGLPAAWSAVVAALLLCAIPLANLRNPLWVGAALGPWLLLLLGLLAATLLVRRWINGQTMRRWMTQGQMRAAWALLVAAAAIRLAGAVHPLFNSHDVDVHMRWLDTVASGQWYLYSTPSEARNRQIFNPPSGYTLLLPLGLLLPSTRLAVQVGTALADTAGCLALLLIARELRLPPRGALLALALYATLPITMTILWWGFSANIIAEALWLVLLWLVLRLLRRPSYSGAAILAVVVAAALMAHIGALLLTGATLGLLLVFTIWQRWRPTESGWSGWRLVVLTLAGTTLVLLPLYFSAAVAPLLADNENSLLASADGSGFVSRATPLSRMAVLAIAEPRAYTLLLLALTLPGLLLLLGNRRRAPLTTPVVLAWAGACLLFWAIHMSYGMLTRYLYFAAPLICLAAGVLLGDLWRSRAGRWVALGVTLYVAWVGLSLWLPGVFERFKPSALPLSH